MTYSNLTTDYSRSQALLRSKRLTYRTSLYSLFRKDNNQWVRISTRSYTESLAYRVFGDWIAKDIMGYSIRKIKIEPIPAK